MQQPTSAIVSAILQHLSGISSRIAQTRASSAILATGSDESMDHDWSLSIGLDPTLTLTSATGNISQFTADAYARSHVMLMLRSAAELTMQAMVSLAPKISQMGVYNRDLCGPIPKFLICWFCDFFFVGDLFCTWTRRGLTRSRYENPLLLALAAKHVQFKEFVASSLSSLGKLDFTTALQKTHLAREFARQIADEAPKGALFDRGVACFFCCAICFCDLGAPRSRLRAFKSQFLAASKRAGVKMRCVRVWVAVLDRAVWTRALTGYLQHPRWCRFSGLWRYISRDPV